MKLVVQLEGKIASISPQIQASNNLKSYNLGKLSASFPFINWTSFFNKVFQDKPEFKVNDSLEILVQEDFISGVNHLINQYKIMEGGNEIMNNYMMWRLMSVFFPDRPDNTGKEMFPEIFKPVRHGVVVWFLPHYPWVTSSNPAMTCQPPVREQDWLMRTLKHWIRTG